MKRTSEQMLKDIMSSKYNFEKSKELAPVGYKWVMNIGKTVLDWYAPPKYIVLPKAYNMYGEEIEGFSLYELKGE